MKIPVLNVKSLSVIVTCCFFSTILFAQAAQTERNPKDNTVKTVLFNEGQHPSKDELASVITEYTGLDMASDLKLKFSHKEKNGTEVARYAQWYNNVQVEHGSISVMMKDNTITFINCNIFHPSGIHSVAPVLSENEALNTALQYINAKEYMWEHVSQSKLTIGNSSYQLPVATLVWVEDFTNDELDRQLHLAYKFDIYAKEPVSRDLVYVDAVTGKVLLKDAIIKHVGATGTAVYSGSVSFTVSNTSQNVYEMYDSNRVLSTYDLGGGTDLGFANLISNNSTTFSKSIAVDAHWGATNVWDYWMNEHSWNSYDGQGSELYSVINYDVAYNNAFWNGFAMLYGNGTGMFNSGFEPLVCLDVCAHEIGHGVCQSTSSLVYSKESGAMNEGFSDIWGAVIEHYGAPEKEMWAIGEEIRVGALRSMSNPKLFKNPDCYTGNYWTNVVGCSPNNGNDQCGVHNNSGVLNHWFYLLTEGGKGTNDLSDDFVVAGIGVKKAAAIAFLTEQSLSATATYADCRATSIGAASTMYGNCSREVEAVTRAWYAVGVGAAFSPCAPQIGFGLGDTTVSKAVPGIICPSAKTISIPMKVTGNAPTGGNASVAVTGIGTAVDGVDFKVLNSPLTFNSGSTASQNIQLSIIDNGDVTKDKVVKLYFTITQNGSNASTSYTYDTCVVTIIGARTEPDTNGNVHHMVNTANVKSKAITPFFSRNKLARSQFIVTAEELLAAGVKPNEQITALEFNVTQKNSTQAFNNFNLKLAATTVKDVSAGNPTVTTVYYNGNLTTQAGWNTLQFSTPFIWNGTDNLAIETCFSNLTAGTENDFVEGIVLDNPATSIAHTNSGTDGCVLPFTSGNYYYSIAKPVIRLVQPTFATQVEMIKVASRPWDVNPGQSVYFTNDTTGKLIANMRNASVGLGCTIGGIVAQGKGLTTIPCTFYQSVNRSIKEFAVTPTNNPTSGNTAYKMTLYFDTSELSGVNLANTRVVGTNAALDTAMDGDNTEIAIPNVITKGNYIAFETIFAGQSFTGIPLGVFNNYFITDNSFPLKPVESVEGISKNTGNIRVVNNPFTDKIYISYTLTGNTTAQIRLYDITGKTLLNKEEQLAAGSSRFEVNVSDKQLAPGNYILQVITGSEVMMQKMVKQ